mmetsp:Transcript_26235/g.32356  ORF Transcript_26235/g.32356 Transcript_26235/m.32356 type:complete len:81 (+) Transcript_26235:183-425(+)
MLLLLQVLQIPIIILLASTTIRVKMEVSSSSSASSLLEIASSWANNDPNYVTASYVRNLVQDAFDSSSSSSSMSSCLLLS